MTMALTELKLATNSKTSEELFGFPKQPENQCPNIDSILQSLKYEASEIQSAVNSLRRNAELDFEELANDLDWRRFNLSDIENEVENIRQTISELREWGQHWKDLCDQILDDNENINYKDYKIQ